MISDHSLNPTPENNQSHKKIESLKAQRAFSRREIIRLLGLGTAGLVVGSTLLQSKPAAQNKTKRPTRDHALKALRSKQARTRNANSLKLNAWVYKIEPVPGIRYPRSVQRKMRHARFATPQEAYAAMQDPTLPFRIARRRNRSEKGAKI